MKTLISALDALSRLLFAIAAIAIAVIVCLVAYEVASRNFGLPNLFWSVSTVEYAMLHITFLTLPWLVRTRGHVSVEILLTYMPSGLRKGWETLLHILAAVICLYMSYRCWLMFMGAVHSGDYEVRSFDAPMWMVYSTLPVGFFLGGVQFLSFPFRGESFFGGKPEDSAGF